MNLLGSVLKNLLNTWILNFGIEVFDLGVRQRRLLLVSGNNVMRCFRVIFATTTIALRHTLLIVGHQKPFILLLLILLFVLARCLFESEGLA